MTRIPRRILTTHASLLNYAAWYALRYAPSHAKLRDALMKKSDNQTSLVDGVMGEMGDLVREDHMIEGLIRMWTDQGKTERYMRGKLREKQYNPEIVEQIFSSHFSSQDGWRTYEQGVLNVELERISDRYDLADYKSRGRCIQRYMRKGFAYRDIVKAMECQSNKNL